ncbi:1,4-dihydroxy-2-naphthoate polyprenyltransferase [Sphaerobacter sp.]|uniref:1,4-dihydroxy-2-naphthoate polyprenyltransferase n=1 Tax=Sphaerobacter sp. TaxID=2099654 RepID=UPI001E134C4B|nr:1,4-dihydroxy-2-naphthoate polyprenyltransferase [Sphaerobacter sp.]
MQQSGTLTPPSRIKVWVMAARLPTLPAAIAPVLVGTAAGVAAGTFRPLPFLAALVAAVLIQIGTNYANDLSDFHKGADTAERLGPVRVTQRGLVTPEQMKRATILTFGAAALVGLYLVVVGGWPILVIGLLSILCGWAYTGGPWPFGYHGLGDLFVFIFFGVIAVNGSAYLQSGTVDALSLAVSVPVGLLVTNILVINNLRDIDTDRAAGKRTLAVRIGARASRIQYALFAGIAYLVPLLLWLTGAASAWVLLSWLSLPLGIALVRTTLGGATGTALNPILKRTGQLHLLFGALLALGLLL